MDSANNRGQQGSRNTTYSGDSTYKPLTQLEVQQEKDKKMTDKERDEILRNFDMDKTYGACMNISRKERLKRAIRFNIIYPSTAVFLQGILDLIPDDNICNVSVLDRH